MKYDNKLVTKDGITLMTDSITNKENPIIDKMLVLNTDVPEGKTPDSLNLNDFSNALSFDVNNVSQTANSFTASAVISNSGININYTAQLIGLSGYLNESSNNRKLFAVAQATEPFVIEKQADTPITLVPSITIGFSNSENVQLTVKNDVYVTHDELETLKADIAQNISGPDSVVSKNIAQAKTDSISHSDSNRDNLQTQINGRIQDSNNYASNLVDKSHDQLSSDISSAKTDAINQSYHKVGNLSGDLLNIGSQPDGYYNCSNVYNIPGNFSSYGIAHKYTVANDVYLSYVDNIKNSAHNHLFKDVVKWSGWQVEAGIKFFSNLNDVTKTSAPEGTIAIVTNDGLQ
ncbi:hypothetical protein [Apilactobacillus quenuiae]|uniref:hypothetical protein n=1 Tax=Apilactobacillus quenuiae TaxID=2008377 RepID=UPI000D01A09A|nr:hypothetical protein [Apilactobacillus quenuiae]